MSPFMTVEVIMTESAYRADRKHRRFEDHSARTVANDRRGPSATRRRWRLGTLFHPTTWSFRSV